MRAGNVWSGRVGFESDAPAETGSANRGRTIGLWSNAVLCLSPRKYVELDPGPIGPFESLP